MKRLVVGGAVLALGVAGTGLSFAGTADGQGAQKRALTVTDESNGGCNPGGDATGGPNGFVILNAAGKVGDVQQVVGEVSLKNAPGTYTVELAVDGTCTPQGVLTTNSQGNGNFHISLPSGFGSTYFVVLRAATGSSFASGSVPLI